MTNFRWGAVTSIAPLRLRLDGDSFPLPFTPDSLVDPLTLRVGDRVRCETSGGRLTIHGVAGGVGVESILPAGVVMAWAGDALPASIWGWADGGAVSRTQYPALFQALGTRYGVGDGSTTFNLPDLRGRLIVGLNAADPDFDVLGEAGGSKTAGHAHALSSNGYAKITGDDSNDWITGRQVSGKPSWEGTWRSDTGTLTVGPTTLNYTVGTELGGATDSGSASTLSPFRVLNYIILLGAS